MGRMQVRRKNRYGLMFEDRTGQQDQPLQLVVVVVVVMAAAV
jgi:hypothetical protein